MVRHPIRLKARKHVREKRDRRECWSDMIDSLIILIAK